MNAYIFKLISQTESAIKRLERGDVELRERIEFFEENKKRYRKERLVSFESIMADTIKNRGLLLEKITEMKEALEMLKTLATPSPSHPPGSPSETP